MLADSINGARCALRGFRLVRADRVWPWAVLPLAINGVVFGAAIVFGAAAFSDFIGWLLPAWLDMAIVHVLLWVIFAVAVALVAFYAFALLANLIAAPFNGWLADRTERHLRGQVGTEGIERGAIAELGATLRAELVKLVYLALWSIPLLLLLLIPGLNLLAPVAWLVFGAWMLSLEYLDYPLGNHGLTFREARALVRQRPGAALGFGGVIMALTAIPVVNLVAMPAAVAGAAALYVDVFADSVDEAAYRTA